MDRLIRTGGLEAWEREALPGRLRWCSRTIIGIALGKGEESPAAVPGRNVGDESVRFVHPAPPCNAVDDINETEWIIQNKFLQPDNCK
jgi:hypothetical protein